MGVERALQAEGSGSAETLRLNRAWGAQGAGRRPAWLKRKEHRERGRRWGPRGNRGPDHEGPQRLELSEKQRAMAGYKQKSDMNCLCFIRLTLTAVPGIEAQTLDGHISLTKTHHNPQGDTATEAKA